MLHCKYCQAELPASKKPRTTFALTLDQFAAIRSADRCHYCCGGLNPTGSGLDRKDNALGYTVSNVVPCCKSCNLMKGDRLTHDEMIAAIGVVMTLRRSSHLRVVNS